MTLESRQRAVDADKWYFSEARGEDFSGQMPYCAYCEHKVGCTCNINQEQREVEYACAKAYEKMKEDRG